MNMFESQNDWFQHEVEFHRKVWACRICNDNIRWSRPELNEHLRDRHTETENDETSTMKDIESWRLQTINATECPLCQDYARKFQIANRSPKCDVLLKHFQSHLGGHFEQLAFAALPNHDEDAIDVTKDRISEEEDAEDMLELQDMETGKGMSAEEHSETLTSMTELALSLRRQGKYEEAEPMYRKALQLTKKVLGPEHPETLMRMIDLASLLSNQGKYNEAESIYRQTLQLREEVLGLKHPDTLTSMHNLVSVLSNQGKYDEAESLCRKTLQLKEEVLGPEYPSTLRSKSHLAWLLDKQGKDDEAESIYRRTLPVMEMVLGSEHPETRTIKKRLELLLKRLGN